MKMTMRASRMLLTGSIDGAAEVRSTQSSSEAVAVK
jgi:hypothetical protein